MFYYVDGTVSVLQQGLAVIDCGGVGYACHASQNTIGKLKTGEKARLLTWLNVREGVFELYGFIDEEEKSCFLMLTSVNGVGPKAALSILSVAPPDRLALSIITGDEKMLMQAPGIGKKIAQRIVLELRDKMSKEQGGVWIYNLGTGVGYSVLDVIHAFEEANNLKVNYVFKDRRAGDVPACYCDPSKAERELGWKAKNGIKEMCEDSWRWQKNNPNGYEE